jgi:hypothetical protein
MITLKHPIVEEVLYQGLEDWVMLTTIVCLVEQETPAWWRGTVQPGPDEIKAETLAVCEFLLSNGLMCAGELSKSVADPAAFLDWPQDAHQTLERINGEWDHLVSLEHFEPCWFRSTASGLEAGKAVDG